MSKLEHTREGAEVAAAVLAAHDASEPLLVFGSGSKAGFLRPTPAARSLLRNHDHHAAVARRR